MRPVVQGNFSAFLGTLALVAACSSSDSNDDSGDGVGGNATGNGGGGAQSGVGGAAPASGAANPGGSSGNSSGGGTGVGEGGAGGTGGASNPNGGSASGGASTGGTGTGGVPGSCDPGSSATTWASSCPTAPPSTCVAGTWKAGGPDPDHANYKLLSESEHFAVYSDENPTGAQAAVDHLELVWKTYFGAPIYMKEPLCDSATKTKASIHVHSTNGLTGGSWAKGRMGMWIGTGGLKDHWGLAHEFAHGVQAVSGGMSCGGNSNFCGWIHESHANWMAHQLAEYRANEHCSEMSFNAPHLYLGSTRDRYCNWQFMEYLKDKYCFSAVNAIWTSAPANDPFTNIMKARSWDIGQANDFFGEWAMHNVTWDYKDPEPIVPGAGGDTDPAAAFRKSYASITDTTSRAERRLRLTRLDPLGDDYGTTRRFVSPYFWAPQRYGYNVVRLFPEAGAGHVTVTFRGVTQNGANSDWRWGLVATSADVTTSRYSALQKGADATLDFCVGAGEQLFLVVVGTPSVQQQINWDQAFTSIYRYPYMVALQGAWPDGFKDGKEDACPSGTTRVANGGGCGPANLPASVFVGPYAAVLGGTVSGNARIEDHAAVVNGTVSGGTITALSTIGSKPSPNFPFNVSGSATVKTTFYPAGFFENGQSLTGSATLYRDVEFRGQGFSMSSGSYSGIVSSTENTKVGTEVTAPPPYAWRQ